MGVHRELIKKSYDDYYKPKSFNYHYKELLDIHSALLRKYKPNKHYTRL